MLRYTRPADGREYSSWYIRGIASTILTCLRFLVEMRILLEPVPFAMPRFRRPLPQVVEADRMQQIIDVCEDFRLKILMAFFFDSGLRIAEVCAGMR